MPRISINEMTTYHWSFLEDVVGYQAAGFERIGVWRRKLSDFGEERASELLRESNLTVSCYSCAGGFTGSDGQTYREAVDDALDALRMAAEIEAECLVVIAGAQAGHIFSHARRLLRDALRELGDVAAQSGLSIALQPFRRQRVDRCSFLTSLDATLEMLAWCGHPHVGLVFDFFHLCDEPNLNRRIPEMVPWIKIAALCDARRPARSDNDRCLPGQGQLPLAEMICALEANGYRGAYDVQLLSEHCWKSDYPALLGECHSALAKLAPRTFPWRDRVEGAAVPPG